MIKTLIINGTVVASFVETSRINALISEPVKEELKLLYSKPNTRLILDLSGISYIDSSGFGIFLSIMRTAINSKGQFKICNINEDAMRLFKMLQLHNVFEIYNNCEDALKSFT